MKAVIPKSVTEQLKREIIAELETRKVRLDGDDLGFILDRTQAMIDKQKPHFDNSEIVEKLLRATQLSDLERQLAYNKTLIWTKEVRSDFIDDILKVIPMPKDGKDGTDGEQGESGDQYNLTTDDKIEIAGSVKLDGLLKEEEFTKRMAALVDDIKKGKLRSPNRSGGPNGKEIIAKIDSVLGSVWQGGDGATTWLALTDTPSSYAGALGRFPMVNAGETGEEFSTEIIEKDEKILIGTATDADTGSGEGVGTHKLQIDGYLRHEKGWKDNIQPFSSARGNGTTEPVWSDIGNGNYAMRFTTGDELFVNFHIDHDYAPETKAYPHIHFCCANTQDAGDAITWRFSYIIAKGHQQGGSFTGARTNIDLTYTYTGSEVAGEHIIVEASDLQAFSLVEVDSVLMAGIELLSETVGGQIYGIMCDLHYQTDRSVTLNKSPNFYGP